MEARERRNAICRSVFKGGGSTTSTKQFTQKWIELINQIERGKRVSLAK